MARSRNIKPGFFTNGDLLECQPLARLLFAGLWTEADCRGILEDRPKFIKIKVLPGDNCDVDELLSELQDAGFILRYQVGEARCIFVKNFDKHQNPHQNEKPNSLPVPEELSDRGGKVPEHSGASTVQAPERHQSDPADSLLLIPDPLEPSPDGDGRAREEATDSGRKRPVRLPDPFEVTDRMYEWARSNGFPRRQVDSETEQFLDYHRGKASRQADWEATWRTWMRNTIRFGTVAKEEHRVVSVP